MTNINTENMNTTTTILQLMSTLIINQCRLVEYHIYNNNDNDNNNNNDDNYNDNQNSNTYFIL